MKGRQVCFEETHECRTEMAHAAGGYIKIYRNGEAQLILIQDSFRHTEERIIRVRFCPFCGRRVGDR